MRIALLAHHLATTALAVAFIGIGVPASAMLLVDTGQPLASIGGLTLQDSQDLAISFTLNEPTIVRQFRAFLHPLQPGSIRFELRDGGPMGDTLDHGSRLIYGNEQWFDFGSTELPLPAGIYTFVLEAGTGVSYWANTFRVVEGIQMYRRSSTVDDEWLTVPNTPGFRASTVSEPTRISTIVMGLVLLSANLWVNTKRRFPRQT